MGCPAALLGKAQGSPIRPGVTGEGKAGYGLNASESLLMPRQANTLVTGCCTGWQGPAAERRKAAAKDALVAVRTPPSPGLMPADRDPGQLTAVPVGFKHRGPQ